MVWCCSVTHSPTSIHAIHPRLLISFSKKYPVNSSTLPSAKMEPMSICSESSPSLPPLPEKRIVLGCGSVTIDYLATVAAFPKPDDKIRSTSLKVQGGGNTGNALTAAARLGLTSRLISKVSEGNSPFTYVIVDEQTKTRTCIHTPGDPAMVPDDLSLSNLSSALNGARLVYFDGRLHETAFVIAKEATRRNIPILIDAERKREGLDDLLNLADYVVCSEKFPQAWTTAPSVSNALLSMLLRLPRIKFVIVTLGESGCIMLERSSHEGLALAEVDIDSLLESLKRRVNANYVIPTCVSSESVVRLTSHGLGTINGRLFVGTAEQIPPSELVDTTGAGDAFIGAILYALCIWRCLFLFVYCGSNLCGHAHGENVAFCSSSGSSKLQGTGCSDRSTMAWRSTLGCILTLDAMEIHAWLHPYFRSSVPAGICNASV